MFYNFSKEYPGDNFDNLEYLNISVVTPFGLAKYLRNCINEGLYSNIFFFPYLLVVEKNDEDEIMNFIKVELQSLYGRTENELLLKAIRKFSWESEEIPEVYNRLFK